MDPDRHRRVVAREPLWGSTRLLVLLAVLAVMLGGLVGVVSTHAKSRQPQPQVAPPPTAVASTASPPAPSTSVGSPSSAPPHASVPSHNSSAPVATTLHPPATTLRAPSSSSSVTTTSRVPAKADTPILQQHGARPMGVDELLSPFVGGATGETCKMFADADFRGPTVSVDPHIDHASSTETAIGTPLRICFHRFSAGRTISVTVVPPAGGVQRFTVCYNCTKDRPTSVLWYTVAGQPLGRYQVIATQETTTAIATIIVSNPPDRRIYVAGQDPESRGAKVDPIGTAFRLSLTGYDPNEQVWLLVYRNPDPRSYGAGASYQTRVRLGLSARGETLFHISTSAGDPKGCYVFDTSPTAVPGGENMEVDWGNVFCIA